MRAEKLISRHPLDNGLTLEFWDLSRPMIGERWIVVLEARIAVAIGPATLPPELQGREAEVVRGLGPEVSFAQRDVRNFIDIKEFEATIQEMKHRLLTQVKPYLGHPQFASRFIGKRFGEYQQKQRWSSRQTL
jgi:hypothetical protein